MKTLYIIRHAKAEDHSWETKDYDRNTVPKGLERTNHIADKLIKSIEINEKTHVLSSSANRAIQTATLFCKILGYPISQIRQDQTIYEAHYIDILKSINKTPNDKNTLLVFGHNPGLSDLTHYLTNTFVDLKTSHVAVIELEDGIDFSNLSGATSTLKTVITE